MSREARRAARLGTSAAAVRGLTFAYAATRIVRRPPSISSLRGALGRAYGALAGGRHSGSPSPPGLDPRATVHRGAVHHSSRRALRRAIAGTLQPLGRTGALGGAGALAPDGSSMLLPDPSGLQAVLRETPCLRDSVRYRVRRQMEF